MAEYIERDEAVRKALDACVKVIGHGINQIEAVDIADAVDEIPTADVVEVRHGEWVREYGRHGDVVCSECRSVCHLEMKGDDSGAWEWVRSNYCPNCGAKMDGKDKSE